MSCVFYLLWMMVSCRRAHVLFVFFIYCGWWCHVGGLMSCVFYLLWMVVSCRRAHVLCFLFTVDGGVL
jgi:hypothetical protein